MREARPGARRLRPLLWVLLALLVLAVAAPFVLKDRNGRPLLSPADLRMPKVKVPDLPGLPGKGDAPITVYKWRDPEGAWHYSDRPPEPGAPVEAEAVEVGTPTVAPEPPPPPGSAAPEAKRPSGLLLQLPDVLQKARDARDTADAQGADLQERLDAAGAP